MRLPRLPSVPRGEEGGMERWLITYADMITLLLVMFIVLYSTANTDLEKFKAMAESLAEGFGATAPSTGGMPSEAGGRTGGASLLFDTSGGGTSPISLFPENQTPIELFQFEKMLEGAGPGEEGDLLGELQGLMGEAEAAALAEGMDIGGITADIQVGYNERGIRLIITPSDILFRSGSAILRPEFQRILTVLAEPLSRLRNRIEVQGHTDNVPINTATFPSNWELSAGRAGAVIRFLERQGLPSARLQAAGYADTVPVATNDTRQGRAQNRRVEILILREEGEAYQPSTEQSSVIEESTTPSLVGPPSPVEPVESVGPVPENHSPVATEE